MSFTDEDLEQFKKWTADYLKRGLNGANLYPVRRIAALLTRLKAAEEVCEAFGNIECDPTEITGIEDALDAFNVWRKAAGR